MLKLPKIEDVTENEIEANDAKKIENEVIQVKDQKDAILRIDQERDLSRQVPPDQEDQGGN